MRARIACLLVVSAVALGASPPVCAGAKEELAAWQGTWKLVSLEVDGETPDLPQPAQWVIKGDKVLYGGTPLAVLSLDTATTPKSVDLRFLTPEKVYEGVYSLSEDTLK